MTYHIEKDGEKSYIRTKLKGKALMFYPILNKGSAFTEKERNDFGLAGRLPPTVETIDQQVKRAYCQYQDFTTDEAKSIYLHALYNSNEILFYKLLITYIEEMTDKLYTPTVSQTVQDYNMQFRQPRGLFITYRDENRIGQLLDNRSNPDLDLIVISDGEAILGIGDQGLGGMGIPVAKAAMHVAAGGISPFQVAPLFADVGTNNTQRLQDPFYLGLRENRIGEENYQAFMSKLMDEIYEKFPNVVVHFEDFSKHNARWLLEANKNRRCFNDDIEGTATIVLAAIMTAMHHKKTNIKNERILLVGPGAAGLGIMDGLCAYLTKMHDDVGKAKDQLWLAGRKGLVTVAGEHDDAIMGYAKKEHTELDGADLLTIVKAIKPTILIGVTGKENLFDDAVIDAVLASCEEPVIMPLSNPSSYSECNPSYVFSRVKQHIYMATGSPFTYFKNEMQYSVSQCNNIFAFPGLAAGMIACRAKKLTQSMIVSAAEAISAFTLEKYSSDRDRMTPHQGDLREVTQHVARAVVAQAIHDDNADFDHNQALTRLKSQSWEPHYMTYQLDED